MSNNIPTPRLGRKMPAPRAERKYPVSLTDPSPTASAPTSTLESAQIQFQQPSTQTASSNTRARVSTTPVHSNVFNRTYNPNPSLSMQSAAPAPSMIPQRSPTTPVAQKRPRRPCESVSPGLGEKRLKMDTPTENQIPMPNTSPTGARKGTPSQPHAQIPSLGSPFRHTPTPAPGSVMGQVPAVSGTPFMNAPVLGSFSNIHPPRRGPPLPATGIAFPYAAAAAAGRGAGLSYVVTAARKGPPARAPAYGTFANSGVSGAHAAHAQVQENAHEAHQAAPTSISTPIAASNQVKSTNSTPPSLRKTPARHSGSQQTTQSQSQSQTSGPSESPAPSTNPAVPHRRPTRSSSQTQTQTQTPSRPAPPITPGTRASTTMHAPSTATNSTSPYDIPSKLQSVVVAMGQMNWEEYVELMERFVRKEIEEQELKRLTNRIFRMGFEKAEEGLRKGVEMMVRERVERVAQEGEDDAEREGNAEEE